MTLVLTISYIDRNTLALLAPTILKETHLSGEQYGFIISAFSIAYMIGNPIWGRLLDRIGLRRGMTGAVTIWTVASAAHAFAVGFWSFASARALLGFGEGATFPGGLRTVTQTLPAESRSRGVAVAYSGGSLGAIITPILITPIALRWGWRGAFWFTGLAGFLWLLVWRAVSRRGDLAHAAQPTRVDPVRWRDRRLWAFLSLYALGAVPVAFVLYGAALYLARVLGKSQGEVGAVLWIPPLGWEAGYFFWGWATDRFTEHGESLSRLRGLLGITLVLMLPLALTARLGSFALVMAELFLAMFVAGGFIIMALAYATCAYSTSHSGLIAGLGAGGWSAVVACVMPFFGRLFDLHRWDLAFVVATAFPVAGYAGWLLLSKEREAS